jgi:mRNA interferase RelE/StbE
LNVQFKASFAKDIRKIKNRKVLQQIMAAIKTLEEVQKLDELQNLKKLKGNSNYYRIKIGDYRIGLTFNNNIATCVRCLSRKDIYRYFP